MEPIKQETGRKINHYREHDQTPGLRPLYDVFLKIGILSFGGPAAQISLMHRYIVEERNWLSEKQYLSALSFCMMLPGPEAMQLATYVGWKLHGLAGGLIAGLLFVLPGAAVVLGLAIVYAYYGSVPLVGMLFLGVKSAVLVVVIEALLRVAKRALKGGVYWAIATFSFIGIFVFDLPYPLIVLSAAIIGFFWHENTTVNIDENHKVDVSIPQTLKTIAIWLVIWLVPIGLMSQLGFNEILLEVSLFFSKLAVVTFGGAYAVLAYMGQDIVGQFGWLNAGEMMDGLGLAETTPGPLILVTEFVGFIAAFREGGIGVGLAGAAVTLWVTFVPCFLWIFAGAPYIDWISEQVRLAGALSAITAAVVGVILNLSIWFGLHVIFETVVQTNYGLFNIWQPVWSSFDWRVIVLTGLSGVLLLKLHWNIIWVLIIASISGVILSMSF